MAFFKFATTAAVATVLLLDLTSTADACRCVHPSVCDGFEDADVVVRGLAHSRSNPGPNVDVTYTLEAINFYKGDPQDDDEKTISFTTAPTRGGCGIYLELDEEYLIGLYQDTAVDSFTANACGLNEKWSSVSKPDMAAVEACCPNVLCDPRCNHFQECLLHSDHLGDRYYCADVCDPSPCEDEEECTLEQLVQCIIPPCPPEAVCT